MAYNGETFNQAIPWEVDEFNQIYLVILFDPVTTERNRFLT